VQTEEKIWHDRVTAEDRQKKVSEEVTVKETILKF
jgi:hypothetical protein